MPKVVFNPLTQDFDFTGSGGGSSTWGSITGTLSAQTDLQTALNAKANDSDTVHKTGAETIAGSKTFTGYVSVADEAYGAGWNGSTQVPTKNAIYDKIEALGPSVTNDQLQDQELTATYAYVGYENTADNSWYIYRRTRATNLRQYATGATDYATNWTGRAGLTYVQPKQEIL